MNYYVTLEVRTNKKLNEEQMGKLRDAILESIDVGGAGRLPYKADVVTAGIGEEGDLHYG